ncbi:myo-inosose-2 dehydratase [Leucothrix pacifica]|uniref:Myo-inosose-2 dehydratase n=1 Tax=Leucothrix pacifica TaxID=1247513 RepID=A0A317C1E8_9GAMM|nr:myo-inosose-2 dehydratase [Leucothrix pacifica]PWQ92445.1 myo-inosose-2 dehydratase [Leucothrix pacifica]
MSVRIGINPLTWTNDDMPELGGDTPLDVCLSEGKQAGYSGFELGQKFPRTPEVLGPILSGHDLVLVSGWFSGGVLEHSVEDDIEAIKPHLHLLKELGSDVLIYCDTSGSTQTDKSKSITERPIITDEAQWKKFAEDVTAVADYVASQGLKLAYHHHMGTTVQTVEEVDMLMKYAGDSVGLLLDTGHITYAGGDPVDVQQRYADRIRHVHCKDIRREVMEDSINRNSSFLDSVLNGVFTVPGDGCVDYPAVFKGLKESNYSGWLVVEAEQDPAVAHPLTYAKMGHANLAKYCADAGIEVSA